MIENRFAFVYGGQGSQEQGKMGAFLLDFSRDAKAVFERASNALGFSVVELINKDPAHKLYGDKDQGIKPDPEIIQGALFTSQVATSHALAEFGVAPAVIRIGHSSGQYSAFENAKVGEFEPLLNFVRERGQKMREMQTVFQARLGLVFGVGKDFVNSSIQELRISLGIPDGVPFAEETVRNTETRSLVLMPDDPTIWEGLLSRIKDAGGRLLPYSDAPPSHYSGLTQLRDELAPKIPYLKDATFPVISDLTGKVITTAIEIRELVERHVVSNFDWRKSINEATGKEIGAKSFVIVGPSRIQEGMLAEVAPNTARYATDTLEGFINTVAKFGNSFKLQQALG